MNKLFILLILTVSCAHQKKKDPQGNDLVTLRTALEQAQMSYLKGCVDVYVAHKLGPAFNQCKELAKKHRLDLDNYMKD